MPASAGGKEHHVRRLSRGIRLTAIGLAAVQVFFVGVAAAPFSFGTRTVVTREIVIVILFTAIVTTALAFAALMWA